MTINRTRRENAKLLIRDVKPEDVIRAAYATLKVIQDEKTIELGRLKSKYRGIHGETCKHQPYHHA